jgi:bacteriocin biosynthesis cyclodehydratase domain-containing protein
VTRANAFGHDDRMVLKLDARYPLIWRSPWDIQFGIDPVRVILRDVDSVEERLIAALVAGISRSGLSMIAESAGASETRVETVLRKLSPVIDPSLDRDRSPEADTRARFVPPAQKKSPDTGIGAALRADIVGRGPTVERLARILAQSGVRLAVASSATVSPGVSSAAAHVSGIPAREDGPTIGVAIGHYVLDPDIYGYWLRRDIPHLPVVFGDAAVVIGPIIEPGSGPCLYCLDRYRTDADPVWPTLAAQLWGRRSVSETPLVSREVATRAARIVLTRLEAQQPGAAVSLRLDVASGAVTSKQERTHPECGCREVPSPARPGTDSPAGSVRDAVPRPTTSTRVSGAHE